MKKISGLFFVVIAMYVSGFASSVSAVSVRQSSCNTPGTYDGFLLALSWFPGFCQFNKEKKECGEINTNQPTFDYARQNFTLHGLWPQKAACGSHYGYCAGYYPDHGGFCSLPGLAFQKKTFSSLEEVMPSAFAGTCLQRHEWYRHGTCLSKDHSDPNYFFARAVNLTEAFNLSPFVKNYMAGHIGRSVKKSDLQNAFDQSFGKGVHTRMALYCQGSVLEEMRINLPRNTFANYGTTFSALVTQAAELVGNQGSCGSFVYIPRAQK